MYCFQTVLRIRPTEGIDDYADDYIQILPETNEVIYKRKLTLRRPLRHSWRIGLFFSSHGSALTAIPKR